MAQDNNNIPQSVSTSTFGGSKDGELQSKASESRFDRSNSELREESKEIVETTATAQDGEDESAYPHGVRLGVIIAALALNVFIVALSNTIIATAIPTIAGAFKAFEDIAWYSSAELITATAFQLPFGAAYTYLSTKWTFLASTIIFLVGSAICGAAPTSMALIIGRAIAGIGNAGVLGGAFILIARNTPLRLRSAFTGVIGGVYSLASVTGPIIGGALTSNVGWRWTFYFNLPVGVLPIVMITFFLPSNVGRSSKELKTLSWWRILQKFDPIGTILIIASFCCLFIALQWGGAQYAWSNWKVIVLLVMFGVTLLAWIATQYIQGENATVPPSVVKNRTASVAFIYTLLQGSAFAIMVYYIPIWFQSLQGDTAETSGYKQLALVISVSFSTVIAGGLTVKIGYYSPFLIGGAVFTAIGSGLLYSVKYNSSLGMMIGYQILFGIGVGMGLNAATVAVQTVLPDETVAKGISAELTIRLLGTALGTPIAQSVLQQALVKRLSRDVALRVFTSEGSAKDAKSILTGIFGAGTPGLQDALESFNYACTQTFMVAMILSCLCFPMALLAEWKSTKLEKREQEDRKENRLAEKLQDEEHSIKGDTESRDGPRTI